MIFLSGTQDKPADAIGEMNIELSDFCCRRKAEEIFQEIRDKSAELPGIKVINQENRRRSPNRYGYSIGSPLIGL